MKNKCPLCNGTGILNLPLNKTECPCQRGIKIKMKMLEEGNIIISPSGEFIGIDNLSKVEDLSRRK